MHGIHLVIFTVVSIFGIALSLQGHASPGAACPTNGATLNTTDASAGDGHLLVCNAGVWASVLSFAQTGMAKLANSVAFTADISPASIAANQNNYSPTGLADASILRLTAGGAYNITGLAGGADGRTITLVNIGTNAITLTNEDAASTAANRFLLGGNVALDANDSLTLIYDSTTQRWRSSGALPTGGIEAVTGLSAPSAGPTCARRTATTSTATITISCNAGEIMTGGGCGHSSTTATIEDSYPSAAATWSCEWNTAAATGTAYAVCCAY